MNYIILDLEWNQCPTGKADEKEHLPFEIIEIGAVKLDETLAETGRFHEVVRPQVYKKLHFRTKEIVSLRTEDFEKARTFPEVVHDFLKWCGDDPAFCSWGPADLTELQRNLAYYQLPSPFPFPLMYYDIQKIFSIVYEDRKSRRSLESAVNFLQIPKDVPFHSALSDAIYTALITQTLSADQILENSSVDYFRTPNNRRQEVYLSYPSYVKFISKPFETKTLAMKDRVVTSTFCCLCQKNVPKKIRWFSIGSSNYCCLACCPKHGYIKVKIRLRTRNDGKFYAIKTTKPISEEDAYAIREKKEIQRVKRRLRREFSRSENA
jgi:inhibitor of KinA sporulation pathway (predicted exonuclease)